MDTDGDGHVDIKEFRAAYVNLPELVGLFAVSQGERNYAEAGTCTLTITYTSSSVLMSNL